ncbi:MAG: hypothetical protein C0467_28495 [Planctomycetaceae bacterium]|nr:hypothetical protein [Planctomycetaceae bacterium]
MNRIVKLMRVVVLNRVLALLTEISSPRESITPRGRHQVRSRRQSRVTLLWFALVFLTLNVTASIALSHTRVRDPEYGRRASHLRERIAENPERPLVLVLGSSRTAMGVRVAAWEATRSTDASQSDPLIFNMAIIGSGPVIELMTLRRIYADGFRPAAVVLEYWPPFLHQEDGWTETDRIVRDRLSEHDRHFVREHFPAPEQVEREMDLRRRNPIFGNRERLLMHVLQWWLPPMKRQNHTWTDLDSWGWKAGADLEPGMNSVRTEAHSKCAEIYKPLFAAHKISPLSDRALRESVALARQHGTAIAFSFLPESSEFRRLYPAKMEHAFQSHLGGISRELNIPVINCREWMDDGYLVDGFHLSRAGAAEFSRKFGPAISSTFPDLNGSKAAKVVP